MGPVFVSLLLGEVGGEEEYFVVVIEATSRLKDTHI